MAIWTCRSCHASWENALEPIECPGCHGRLVDQNRYHVPSAGGSFSGAGAGISIAADNPYDSPAAIARPTPKGNTLFQWYAITFWVAFTLMVLASFLFVVGLLADSPEPILFSMFLFAAGCMVGLVPLVLGLILLYRGWEAVQPLRNILPEERDMPTPGKAVGFLFIPLFNIYWLFVAYYGLSRRANLLLNDRQSNTRQISEGLFLAYCIMSLLTAAVFVPVLGFVYGVVGCVVTYLMFRQISTIPQLLGR